MRRRRMAAWLLSLPLMLAGSQVAHALAYGWVYPDAHVRLTKLLLTGHGYMVGSSAYLPMLLGAVAALELVAVGWVCAGSVRRSLQRPVPAWAFALLPMLGFTLQELLERVLAGAPSPWLTVLQPTFRVGLLLQLPVALVVYLLARLLLRAAEHVGSSLRGNTPMWPRPIGISLGWIVLESWAPRRCALALGHSVRGPPRAAAPALFAGSR